MILEDDIKQIIAAYRPLLDDNRRELISILNARSTVAGEDAYQQLSAQPGKSPYEWLIETLRHADSERRIAAIHALKRFDGTDRIEQIVDVLHTDAESGVRIQCIITLGYLRDPKGVPPIIKALQDAEAQVRYLAVLALGFMSDDRAVAPLIERLQHDPERNIRRFAAYALGQLRHQSAFDPLLEILTNNHEHRLIRGSAALALGKLGDKRAIRPLAEQLADIDSAPSLAILQALASLNVKNVNRPLLHYLQSSNFQLRVRAAQSLGELSMSESVEPLIEALHDESSKVRIETMRALAKIGDQRALPALQFHSLTMNDVDEREIAMSAMEEIIHQSKDKPRFKYDDGRIQQFVDASLYNAPSMRQDAVEAFLNTLEGDSFDWLMQALQHPDSIVRGDAVHALKWTERERGMEPNIGLLRSDPDPSVRNECVIALGYWQDARGLEPLIQALVDPAAHVRHDAAIFLGLIADQRAIEPLIDVMRNDPDSETRRRAADALGYLQGQLVYESLVATLENEEQPQQVRSSAALALGELGDKRAIRTLAQQLADADPLETGFAIIQALAKLKVKEVNPHLINYLQFMSHDPMFAYVVIRMDAAKSLGELGLLESIEPLINALADRSRNVRMNAAHALAKIGDSRALTALEQFAETLDWDRDKEIVRSVINQIKAQSYE